jgi:hypothetical protein
LLPENTNASYWHSASSVGNSPEVEEEERRIEIQEDEFQKT